MYWKSETLTPNGWDRQKARLKKKFPVLTDEDLKFATGKKLEMFMHVAKKVGITLDEVLTAKEGYDEVKPARKKRVAEKMLSSAK